jgi:hypothetical protein
MGGALVSLCRGSQLKLRTAGPMTPISRFLKFKAQFDKFTLAELREIAVTYCGQPPPTGAHSPNTSRDTFRTFLDLGKRLRVLRLSKAEHHEVAPTPACAECLAVAFSAPIKKRGLRGHRFFLPFAGLPEATSALHTADWINIMVTKRISWYKHFKFCRCPVNCKGSREGHRILVMIYLQGRSI